MIQCGCRGCCGCCGCLSFHVTIFFWYVRIGFRFFSQSSPSAKISGQRTGLRFFSQSSPSAKISDQRIRPRGTSQLDPDSGFPAAIKKKPLSFKIPFKTDKFFAEARPLVFGRLGFFDFLLQSSPSAKISGQRTGLRFFSQSSPSAKISDHRIQRWQMKSN